MGGANALTEDPDIRISEPKTINPYYPYYPDIRSIKIFNVLNPDNS